MRDLGANLVTNPGMASGTQPWKAPKIKLRRVDWEMNLDGKVAIIVITVIFEFRNCGKFQFLEWNWSLPKFKEGVVFTFLRTWSSVWFSPYYWWIVVKGSGQTRSYVWVRVAPKNVENRILTDFQAFLRKMFRPFSGEIFGREGCHAVGLIERRTVVQPNRESDLRISRNDTLKLLGPGVWVWGLSVPVMA